MFQVHTPIIRSIRCWVAAYGFLHRVFGWVVVLRSAAWFVCTVWMVHHPHRTRNPRSSSQDHHPSKNSVQKTICYNSTSNAPAYVPEICRAKNISIKLPCCIKLAFHIISWGRCTVKQPSSFLYPMLETNWMNGNFRILLEDFAVKKVNR